MKIFALKIAFMALAVGMLLFFKVSVTLGLVKREKYRTWFSPRGV